MGTFKKTDSDNERWNKAKDTVRRVKKNAPETDWDDKDWRLANSLFHKMRQSKKKKD